MRCENEGAFRWLAFANAKPKFMRPSDSILVQQLSAVLSHSVLNFGQHRTEKGRAVLPPLFGVLTGKPVS